MKSIAAVLATLLLAHTGSRAAEEIPLNRVQFIGTHNSYHISPSPKVRALIESVVKGQGDAIHHTHRPLTEQLEQLGIRQIELDLYADPKGGMFANPLAAMLAGESVPPNPVMKQPGIKILHSPDFDFKSTVPTFHQALEELAAWSRAHPKHEPVMVLLELEEESFSPKTRPVPFDETQLKSVEAEILAVMKPDEILTPDKVKGDAPTLRDAVTQHGWPPLAQCTGKFIFCLDNGGTIRDCYLALGSGNDLTGRLLFVSVPREHPAAAWMKMNDPVGQFQEIQSLVKAGFMVRTRADADLREIRAKDTRRFEKAAASGAQWISTDAPEELPEYPGYQVSWENHQVWRPNPVNPPMAGKNSVESP